MIALDNQMTRLGAGAGADKRGANLELIDDVMISIFRKDNPAGLRPTYIAFLKIENESAILEETYLWGLLRKIARTILAWGETE